MTGFSQRPLQPPDRNCSGARFFCVLGAIEMRGAGRGLLLQAVGGLGDRWEEESEEGEWAAADGADVG